MNPLNKITVFPVHVLQNLPKLTSVIGIFSVLNFNEIEQGMCKLRIEIDLLH
jgi:hypothetical protein